jgi:hypothetical protein
MNVTIQNVITTLSKYAVENPNLSLEEKSGVLNITQQAINFINENITVQPSGEDLLGEEGPE